MNRLQLLLVAQLVLSATCLAQDLAWPGFRGPLRNGSAPGQTPPLTWSQTENLKWKLEMPGGGASSPIVLGDRIYVACYSGYGNIFEEQGEMTDLMHHLVAVDRSSGKLIWDCSIEGPLTDKPPQVQLTEHGFASATPITDGETIFAYFGRAGMVAIDLEGEILWQTDRCERANQFGDQAQRQIDHSALGVLCESTALGGSRDCQLVRGKQFDSGLGQGGGQDRLASRVTQLGRFGCLARGGW